MNTQRSNETSKKACIFVSPGFSGPAEEGLRLIMDKQPAPSVLGRSAFCESALMNEKRLGCRQYLIFGAGFDTYALRDKEHRLSIFELDREALLREKRARIERAGLTAVSCPVPCDLTKKGWETELLRHGFDPRQKAFASLLGLCYYLKKEDMCAFIAALGKLLSEGSALCFDYPVQDVRGETEKTRVLAAAAGEAMQAEYTCEEMKALLSGRGFLIYEHLDAAKMTERFFKAGSEPDPAHAMRAPAGVAYLLAVRKQRR